MLPCASTPSISVQAAPPARGSAPRCSVSRQADRRPRIPLSSAWMTISCSGRCGPRNRSAAPIASSKRVGVERLGPAQHRGHRLDRGADDIVVGVLLAQASPDVWQCVRSFFRRPFRPEIGHDHAVPTRPGRHAASQPYEQVHADAEEEAQARPAKLSMLEPCPRFREGQSSRRRPAVYRPVPALRSPRLHAYGSRRSRSN